MPERQFACPNCNSDLAPSDLLLSTQGKKECPHCGENITDEDMEA